ncbi:MAG: hypothetical protein WBC19_09535 [Pyrinomonadaceae bacterium]|nr:hypothetical protein [Chloracidobacterium sp.]MBK8304598.1 hypothetical protein [Chloracidobacterium sp.]HRI04460.1 hypothetical protein [Pyrinomonadaceae bacterium]
MDNSGKSVFGLDQNVAAGLAYLPICLCHLIVSIGIIATDKTNKLPRFHAFQSLMLSASMIVAYIVMMVVGAVIMVVAGAADVPALAFLAIIAYVIFLLVILLLVIGLIISCIKGFQGQIFKLPIIGNLADKWSN